MRKLADSELLSLTGLLKLEKDGLAMSKAVKNLIGDQDLQKVTDSSILAMEGRIQGIQQFINENNIASTQEVK
ncbi:MAG: hypothetical protein ACTHVE_05165 [Senegalia sp. (in: firmicutes)]|uniref:hypothetical protein n=1 Tax=Senegalia sp. (in: firmicutes) TaxID=1924098 RepID=UPI003F945DD9